MMHSPLITEKRMTTTVEHEADPKHPGRTAYRITGPSHAAVQDAISAIMNPIDDAGGFASFVGPVAVETDDGWAYGALGETITGARVSA
jgi:hypothetical protein